MTTEEARQALREAQIPDSDIGMLEDAGRSYVRGFFADVRRFGETREAARLVDVEEIERVFLQSVNYPRVESYSNETFDPTKYSGEIIKREIESHEENLSLLGNDGFEFIYAPESIVGLANTLTMLVAVNQWLHRDEKKLSLATARKYIDGNADKTDKELFDGILGLEFDIWHAVELVRDIGWSIDRFEAAQQDSEFFRDCSKVNYARAIFDVADFPAASVEIDPS